MNYSSTLFAVSWIQGLALKLVHLTVRSSTFVAHQFLMLMFIPLVSHVFWDGMNLVPTNLVKWRTSRSQPQCDRRQKVEFNHCWSPGVSPWSTCSKVNNDCCVNAGSEFVGEKTIVPHVNYQTYALIISDSSYQIWGSGLVILACASWVCLGWIQALCDIWLVRIN